MKKRKNFYYVAAIHGDKYEIYVDQAGELKPDLKTVPVFRPYGNEPVLYKGPSYIKACGIADAANSGAAVSLVGRVRRKSSANKMQCEIFE